MLVLGGRNSERSWSGRVDPQSVMGLRMTTPLVVFALKPVYEQINRAWIETPGGGGFVKPAWYRCLLPPQYVDRV